MEVSMNQKLTLATLTAAALGLSSAVLLAEDLSQVKVIYDKDAATRTNMPQREGDAGNLTVTFDPAVAARTNMQRPAETPKPVTVTRDQAVLERTNMVGPQPQAPIQETAATK
jgi:hypothetical protein